MRNPTIIVNEMKDQIQLAITGGFDDPAHIVEYTFSEYEHEVSDHVWLERKIKTFVNGMLLAHHLQQDNWVNATDCDRLDDAFVELDRAGIIARHNYECCQDCGKHYILHEMKEQSESRDIKGYVFYHAQDTDSAVRSGYLYLAFGAGNDSLVEAGHIGNKIVAVLHRHGFRIEWNGSPAFRIKIQINWQRRRIPFAFMS